MASKFVYKVVKNPFSSDVFSSAIVTGPYGLKYRIGSTTKTFRGTTGILCFVSLEDAERFRNARLFPPCYSILKCKYSGRLRKVNLDLFTYGKTITAAVKRSVVWLRQRAEHHLIAPSGTVCVDTVTPIKEVRLS